MIIIDADKAIVGRLSAFVAKKALQGEQVVIVSAENAVISGDPRRISERYLSRRTMQNKSNPEESSKWPRKEDLLLKRIMRGMLPKHSARGKEAARRIRIYVGFPKEFEGKAEKFNDTSDKLRCTSVSLKKLCASI